jgi:hypothetical protein
MFDHKVEIVPFLDRSTAICSCGALGKPFFGSRRTANAKQAIFTHLEAMYKIADDFHEAEYQVKIDGNLECPICKEDLDLTEGDAGLLSQNSPSVISCDAGHEFDAYLKNKTLFLFTDSDAGPFSTSP